MGISISPRRTLLCALFFLALQSPARATIFYFITDPTQSETFTTTSDIATNGELTSNDENTPANNQNITIKIRNVASGQVMQSFGTTTTGMTYEEGWWSGTLDNPVGGWQTGDADIELWHDGAKKKTVRVNISGPPA